VRIGLAFHEQLSDAALQRVDFHLLGISGSGRDHRQLGNVALDSFGKLDLDLGSGLSDHGLPDLDAQLAERAGAILSPLGRATADSLCGERFDLVVGLPIVKDRDLAPHLAHLRFEVAQLLEELPGFRPGQEWHPDQDTPAVRRIRQPFAISQPPTPGTNLFPGQG
jgi:hypothetical protein